MNELQIFNYEQTQIRVVEKDGEPWWVLKDVCNALTIGNSRDVSARLDEDEKGVGLIDTLGGAQETTIINEPGLYNVILRSDKPEAKKFKRWVTHEVLPSIRKTGMYATEELLNNPDFMIQAFQALKEAREKTQHLALENSQQKQIIGELQPKATYYDQILVNKGLVTVTQIAKDYGKSGQWMNKKLHDLKVQYKQSGQWLLYAEYHDKGYTHSQTVEIAHTDGSKSVRMETKWTQKGRLFLYELLRQDGILPVIEWANAA